MKILFICKVCKIRFYSYPSRKGRKKYCSWICRNKSKLGRIPTNAIKKGEHRGIRTEFKKNDKRLIGKNNPNWNDSNVAGWQRAQKMYPIQPCEECGKTTYIHRHHVDGNKVNNDKSNIKFLCPSHHALAHIAMGQKYGRSKK